MLVTPPIPIVAVVGSRKSGKTTAVEAIVKELTRKGYHVATVKHIHNPSFTINPEGKDTWRHSQAGAHITVGVSQNELATVRKVDTSKLTLADIAMNCADSTDIIILEGFRDLVAHDLTIPKVVAVKTEREIEEAMQIHKPIIAFSGSIDKTKTEALHKIPYVNALKEQDKLASIIDNRISPIVKKRRELRETLSIMINGKAVPLNPFVQQVTRNVIYAIVSTLKNTSIKGDEDILVEIRSRQNL